MTPFIMPATVREMLYNRKHTETRSVIERTFTQRVAAFFVACCVLHISMNRGCVDDMNEEILQDFRRCDVELHVPMPFNPNTPAAAQERRAYLTEELHHL